MEKLDFPISSSWIRRHSQFSIPNKNSHSFQSQKQMRKFSSDNSIISLSDEL